MADVDKLFSDYVAEHRAGGEANPRTYLEQVEGVDRDELATLIDGYLVHSSGQSWDAAAFEGSASQQWVAGMERSMGGKAGLWPVLLPRLRERAKIKRAELVERLAAALGVGGETEKVAGFYHRMEQGQLDSKGVSTRVLEALGAIVGSTAEALRSAGEQFGEGQAPSEGTVFARITTPRPEFEAKGMAPPASPGVLAAKDAAAGPPEPGRAPAADGDGADEVERLFTGGD
jgi:hypothetical protein